MVSLLVTVPQDSVCSLLSTGLSPVFFLLAVNMRPVKVCSLFYDCTYFIRHYFLFCIKENVLFSISINKCNSVDPIRLDSESIFAEVMLNRE